MTTVIPALRTPRLQVQMHEPSFIAQLSILQMPAESIEASNTAFLAACLSDDGTTGSTSAHPPDAPGQLHPSLWTVQERLLAICHYRALSGADEADFAVGEEGRFSDYLGQIDVFQPGPVDAGDVGGDSWLAQHLTGAMAEAIERLQGDVPGLAGRAHWIVGAMAAQLVLKGDTTRPDATTPQYEDWLKGQMRVIGAYPGTDFHALWGVWRHGCAQLAHCMDIDFDDQGVVVWPAKAMEGAAANLPPARFRAAACCAAIAHEFARKPKGAG